MTTRGMSKADAAAYVGCESLSTFDSWIAKGIVPGPIPGTHRWDRKAIDLALDRASGITPAGQTSSYAEWKQRRETAA
jgi:hypothetical protein